MRINFFGGDAFSLHTLKSLSHHNISVITNPRSPVSTFAKKSSLPLQTISHISQYTQTPADIAVVVSFGHFLPASIIDSFPLGAINLHPSLLPKYRGPNPIMHALLNDDVETGVSIITLDKKRFDAGLILRQERVDIPRRTRYNDLHDDLAERGAKMIADCMESEEVFRGIVESGWKQDEALVSKAGKARTKDALVDFERMDAEGICRLDRALGDKLLEIEVCEEPISVGGEPGSIVMNKRENELQVVCAKGTCIKITCLQVQDKPKPVFAFDFHNGYQLKSIDKFR